MMGVELAFAIGWHEGALGVGAETRREAFTSHPEFTDDEQTAYLNGVDDGRAGDRWRLER